LLITIAATELWIARKCTPQIAWEVVTLGLAPQR
jgi:hypothetical protein